MADSETVDAPQHDTTQQVTSKTPATKNPKRVAIAARTKQAREAQKKALAKANIIIANNQLKQAETPAMADTPPAEPAKNVLSTTQWLSAISIVVSLVGVYYKREEIKGFLTPKKPQVYTPTPAPPNSPVVPKKGIKPMD